MKNSIISKLFISLSLLGETVSSGEFVGKSDHITTGKVTIKKVANGYLVKLGKDFSLDGAPAPRVGFGKDGEYDTNAQIGELVSKTFSVPLGVATLK